MNNSRTFAYVGAITLFVGAFLPIVSMPVVGSLNYFQNGRGDGVIILILAAVTMLLAATGRTRFVLLTGIAALAMLAFTFFRFQTKLAEARAALDDELAGSPFRGIAEAAIGAIQLQWGWAVLLVGGGLVTWAGWTARRERRGEP